MFLWCNNKYGISCGERNSIIVQYEYEFSQIKIKINTNYPN